jgi:hypothetical protein
VGTDVETDRPQVAAHLPTVEKHHTRRLPKFSENCRATGEEIGYHYQLDVINCIKNSAGSAAAAVRTSDCRLKVIGMCRVSLVLCPCLLVSSIPRPNPSAEKQRNYHLPSEILEDKLGL